METPFPERSAASTCHTGNSPALGAQPTEAGVCFRVWAPLATKVEVLLPPPPGSADAASRVVPLRSYADGWFEVLATEAGAGDRYQFRLDETHVIPDPASRWQPEGPHGPSVVVDASAFRWTDQAWRRPAVRHLVIYELHVGTFTPEGTFAAAAEKLPYLQELGITAIELMPLAEFAGDRNWGYDGVCLFAPEHVYGHPDDLRALVNAAHCLGIAVILDVVYNHFGPDGNYLAACIGEYLDESTKTPWGGAIRYGDPSFSVLRQMLVANVEYWLRDFHIDGFRLDAVHAIRDESPAHVLQEISALVHAVGGFVIAEDNRNDASLCEPVATGGMGFDAVWADDFHHVLRVGQTGETAGYYQDYQGSPDELLAVLRSGWLYQGQPTRSTGARRGTACDHLPPTAFVTCISNHDQAGNRAFGERLHHSLTPPAYRALSALLCFCPFTPMLFMGQEWAASSPFLFFTDHEPNLGALITAGRREEFAAFPDFQAPEAKERIPDPQQRGTYEQSKLRWQELNADPHARVLALYRACLRLRREIPALWSTPPRRAWSVAKLAPTILALHYEAEPAQPRHTLIIQLAPGQDELSLEGLATGGAGRCRLLLSSNEPRFGGEQGIAPGTDVTRLRLSGPETVLILHDS